VTRTEHTEDPAALLRELAGTEGERLAVAILPLGPLTIPTV
jgi:hypothetical protein